MRNQPFSQINVSNPDAESSPDDPRFRSVILAVTILLTFAAIGARVAYVQCSLPAQYIAPWEELIVEEDSLPARDGRILSRDGVVLAQDESRYDIAIEYRWLQTPAHPRWMKQQVALHLTPKERRDPELRGPVEKKILKQREELLNNLASVTGEEKLSLIARMSAIQKRIESMLAAVERNREKKRAERQQDQIDWSEGLTGIWKVVAQELTTSPDRFREDPIILKEELQDHVLLRDVPLNVVASIQSRPALFPGVRIRSASTRTYPHGDLAAHLIGVRKPVPGKEGEEEASGRAGESGIEKARDVTLTGTPGLERHERSRTGERIRRELIRSPIDGEDVQLTIDSRLQQSAEQLLDDAIDPAGPLADQLETIPQGATLVAMDLWTGDILALASSPRPSLTVLAQPTTEQWKQLQDDPRHPLFPRSTRMMSAPGSLFKVVTAIAALESGVTRSDEPFECRGYLDRPDEFRCQIFRYHGVGHGLLMVDDALCRSCQVYFYEMARRIGPEALCDWAGELGLGQVTGIELPGEAAGKLPVPNASGEKWAPGATLQLGVGQGPVLVTPLQMARLFAAIGNGGYLIQPRLTMSHFDELDAPQNTARKISSLSPATLRTIQKSLERVIDDPQGTGTSARIEMMNLAGLNGTAEMGSKPAHAWFAGYAPANNPRVAFALVLENAGSVNVSGEIVRDFVTELLGLGYLKPPTFESTEATIPQVN